MGFFHSLPVHVPLYFVFCYHHVYRVLVEIEFPSYSGIIIFFLHVFPRVMLGKVDSLHS